MATLEYFGKLADLAQTERENVDLPAHLSDTDDLRAWLCSTRGWGEDISDPRVRIAINDSVCAEPSPINQTDRIAFLPPVGGG